MDYFNESRERWQNFLKVTDGDIPEKLIIDGKVNFPNWNKIVLGKMKNGRVAWMPNLVIGEIDGKLVGYGTSYGGPLASQFVHIYSKLGTKRMVQIGTGGGIQPDIDLGDVIISEEVLCNDLSNRIYKQGDGMVPFDRDLIKLVIERLEEEGIPYHLGKTICIYDILLWEKEEFQRLKGLGFVGCDSESGAVGSVARYFGIPAVSYYVCSDNSASGKDLFNMQSKEEKDTINERIQIVLDIALRF